MVAQKILRHQPTQKRSKDRVAVILQAAEKIFRDVGYESATTNAIADKANIPIGSLYQYFRNKNAILESLSQQYKLELQELLSERFALPVSRDTIYDMSNTFLDKIAQFYVDHPAFRVVFYGSCRSDELGRASNELMEGIIDQVSLSLSMIMPMSNKTRIALVSTVLVRAVRSSLPYCITAKNTIDNPLLSEIKIMTNAYIRAAMDPA